jgi:hypothetical protein
MFAPFFEEEVADRFLPLLLLLALPPFWDFGAGLAASSSEL